jgi:microcompartment protein CcmK/EutM
VSADRPNRHLTVKEATTMVVVGADVHKRTHTFVAVDGVGKKLGEKVVSATSSEHHQALRWARERFGAERWWTPSDDPHRNILGSGLGLR